MKITSSQLQEAKNIVDNYKEEDPRRAVDMALEDLVKRNGHNFSSATIREHGASHFDNFSSSLKELEDYAYEVAGLRAKREEEKALNNLDIIKNVLKENKLSIQTKVSRKFIFFKKVEHIISIEGETPYQLFLSKNSPCILTKTKTDEKIETWPAFYEELLAIANEQ